MTWWFLAANVYHWSVWSLCKVEHPSMSFFLSFYLVNGINAWRSEMKKIRCDCKNWVKYPHIPTYLIQFKYTHFCSCHRKKAWCHRTIPHFQRILELVVSLLAYIHFLIIFSGCITEFFNKVYGFHSLLIIVLAHLYSFILHTYFECLLCY